jgi:hypothetical protein
MASLRQVLLSDSSYLKFLQLQRANPKIGIHPINASRHENGEYHHLFRELKKDAQKFKEYTRMTMRTIKITLRAR